MSGLTPTGFVPETVDTITTGLGADQQAAISPTLNLDPSAPLGQLNGIFATRVARCWEILGVLFDARDPDKSSGPLLDANCAITGTERTKPSYSTVLVTLTATQAVATVAPGAFVLQVPGATTTWSNAAPITFATAGTATATFQASVTGPEAALANTITQVNTPVTGLAVTSNSAATPGKAFEEDSDLKARRRAELPRGGASNDDAIAEALTDSATGVAGVTYARCYSNRTGVTDANGTPGHAYQVVFFDSLTSYADHDAIAQKIWDEGPAGVQYYGTLTGTAKDANGNPRTVAFTRVTPVAIYVTATTTKSSAFPADGLAQVAAAIVAKAAASFTPGGTVVELPLRAAGLSVAGVTDVPTCFIGLTSSPPPSSSANITMTPFQIPYVAGVNVVVT